MSRCPECGQKECCGADMAPKLDRYREALEKLIASPEGLSPRQLRIIDKALTPELFKE